MEPEDLKIELPIYIDSSMLSTFRSCPRKFYWSYVCKLRSLGQSVHLVAGGALAAGIDAARKYQFTKSKGFPATIDDLLNAAYPAFSRAWGEFEAPEDSAKNFHNMFATLELYLKENPPFYDSIQPKFKADGEPTTEFSFAIPLGINHPSGEPFIFTGRFDLLGEFHDRPVICDEKTTGSLGTYWTKQWALRGQFMGYCWACKKLGIDVDTAVIRGIGILKTETKFLTAMETYGEHLLARWEQELYNTLELIVHYDFKEHYPYNFGEACASYGGCSFTQLCQAKDFKPWLSNYELNTWSPIALD